MKMLGKVAIAISVEFNIILGLTIGKLVGQGLAGQSAQKVSMTR